MKLKVLFLILALLLAVIFSLFTFMVVKNTPYTFYVLEGSIIVMLVFLIYFYRMAVKPLHIIGNGMELLKEQDFSSRLSMVGQHEADHIVTIFNRMMEQLKNERIRLQEQNHLLNLLINASPMGVIMLDMNEKVSSANQAAIRLLGLRYSEEIEGKKLIVIHSSLAVELVKLSDGSTSTIRLSDSNIYKCSRLSFVDCGYRHPFILIESLTQDVMKAEKKAYEKVIRMISHEVNNTTAGITSTLDTMDQELAKLDNTEDLREVMQVCIERCYRMGRFITNFAEVVKIPVPQLRSYDVGRLVVSCKRFMETVCRNRNIKIHLDLCDRMPSVNLDEVLFEQVLVNILKNAIESIGKEGDIYIHTTQAPLCLEIADNGKGIDKETESKLFSPFFSTKPDGQGIGLIFIREVLTRHDCRFSLKTCPDGLTRFSILF